MICVPPSGETRIRSDMCSPTWKKHISSDMCYSTWETRIPGVMCSPTWETHIPSDMCSPTWKTHISSDICSSTWETRIPCDMCSPTWETRIASDVCSPAWETYIPSDMTYFSYSCGTNAANPEQARWTWKRVEYLPRAWPEGKYASHDMCRIHYHWACLQNGQQLHTKRHPVRKASSGSTLLCWPFTVSRGYRRGTWS